jgi:hypothetical protein
MGSTKSEGYLANPAVAGQRNAGYIVRPERLSK